MRGRDDYEIDINELTFRKEIGSGAYGIVYIGDYNGTKVAIKKLKKESADQIELFKREVEMLKQVRGENIVTFYGAVMSNGNMCHVTEFMDLGTLDNVLEKNALNDDLKLKIIRDVARGMNLMHSFNIIHRDLKPDNVLCKSPLSVTNPDMCKITDFGMARATASAMSMTMTRGMGTPLFMAPEILTGKDRYSKAVDVYSFGILMIVVWKNGAHPYDDYNFPNNLQLQNAIVQGTRPKIPAQCPPKLRDLMTRCWAANTDDRPPFEEVLSALM